ncbi:MAG: HDIG domain-containing protein, partial [Deltaproteobacteria bacterium]|nr:HDIG domain-containing protein [Deltaproteobacteria bacterium]
EIKAPLMRLTSWLKSINHKTQLWIYLIILSCSVTFLLFPNILLSLKEGYHIGEIAEKDIKASQEFLVEDEELTKQRKDEAEKSSLFVYDSDNSKADINRRIRESFTFGRQAILPIVFSEMEPALRSEKLEELKKKYFEILEFSEDPDLFRQLTNDNFSRKMEDSITVAVNLVLGKGIVGNKTVLMSQKGKGIILKDISSQEEKKVEDVSLFYSLEDARKQVSSVIEQNLKNNGRPEIMGTAVKFAELFLRPNITFNKKQTEIEKEKARESVNPIFFKVKKGEMIVREGEKITSTHLIKLNTAAKLKKNPFIPLMAFSMMLIFGILLIVSYTILPSRPGTLKTDTNSLIFVSSSLMFMFMIILVYDVIGEELSHSFNFLTIQVIFFALPLPLGAMLVSIFQGMYVAVAFSFILSFLATIVAGSRVEFFIYFLMGSLLAAKGVIHCRERMTLIKTGVRVGLLNIVIALAIQALFGKLYSFSGIISVITSFLGGILSGVIATGFLPLIEMAFGFTTDIKLLELSSLEQPILKKLMVEAPGTYHHSVIVSNMVEATAESIKANPLLAKVSAYYHDIGKTRKPLYFVENQAGGINRHEKLAPSMSSLILISHVKDGVELAKQNKLGKEILDIIQQHHGTSLISYFYQKAQGQIANKGEKHSPIIEENFRYPGPKPQTKEAGLVLLADSVEAASKTLVDPTPARIQGMVQKIINNIFSDGQLDECELTLKDLHYIAKSFTKTLSGIFHSRIEYPESIAKGEKDKKRENGDTNNVTTLSEKSRPRKNKDESNENLRRLGIP